jgi:hypothetical protein
VFKGRIKVTKKVTDKIPVLCAPMQLDFDKFISNLLYQRLKVQRSKHPRAPPFSSEEK